MLLSIMKLDSKYDNLDYDTELNNINQTNQEIPKQTLNNKEVQTVDLI